MSFNTRICLKQFFLFPNLSKLLQDLHQAISTGPHFPKIAWFVSPNVVGKSRHSLTRIISFAISLRLVCTLRLQ